MIYKDSIIHKLMHFSAKFKFLYTSAIAQNTSFSQVWLNLRSFGKFLIAFVNIHKSF